MDIKKYLPGLNLFGLSLICLYLSYSRFHTDTVQGKPLFKNISQASVKGYRIGTYTNIFNTGIDGVGVLTDSLGFWTFVGSTNNVGPLLKGNLGNGAMSMILTFDSATGNMSATGATQSGHDVYVVTLIVAGDSTSVMALTPNHAIMKTGIGDTESALLISTYGADMQLAIHDTNISAVHVNLAEASMETKGAGVRVTSTLFGNSEIDHKTGAPRDSGWAEPLTPIRNQYTILMSTTGGNTAWQANTPSLDSAQIYSIKNPVQGQTFFCTNCKGNGPTYPTHCLVTYYKNVWVRDN